MDDQAPKLGEVLIAAGVISQLDLLEALEMQRGDPSRPRLGQVLVAKNMATEGEICRALSGQLRLPFVDLRTVALNHGIVLLIPQHLADRYQAIAVDMRGEELVVAMADPTNLLAIDDIAATTRRKIKPVVAQPSLIAHAIGRYYGRIDSGAWSPQVAQDPLHQGFQNPRTSLEEPAPTFADEGFSVTRAATTPVSGRDSGPVEFTGIQPAQASVEQAAEVVPRRIPPATASAETDAANSVAVFLNEALKLGATEIRGESGLDGISIQFKVGGTYREVTTIPKHMQGAVTAALKELAGCDPEEHRAPQEGELSKSLDRGRMKATVKFTPGLNGEKFVLKPKEAANRLFEIEELGLDPEDLDLMNAALQLPRGLILVTGPAGSGVTSTLYAMLLRLREKHSEILTIERAIEQSLPGISQNETDPASGLGFEEALRTLIRSNPTAMMISDIESASVADEAISNAQSGRFVVAGMTADDAPRAVTRLVEMGVDASSLGSATALVIAQRLVRKICPNCKVESEPPGKVLKALGLEGGEASWFRGDGCETCAYTGFLGTAAMFQLMPITDLMKEQLLIQVSETTLMHAAASVGVRTLLEAGVELASAGVTSPEEVIRALNIVEEATFVCPGCAAEIRPDYLVCPFCSTYLGGDTCKGCGKDLNADWQACPYCGEVRDKLVESHPPRRAGQSDGERRVLIVEDDDDVRKVIERVLVNAGFAVIGTDTGDDAIRLVVRHRPDLVLLDIGLPGDADGIEVCKQLRRTPQASLTPIIFLTARSDAETEAAGFEAGADDYLVKPIDEDRLIARVRARLPSA